MMTLRRPLSNQPHQQSRSATRSLAFAGPWKLALLVLAMGLLPSLASARAQEKHALLVAVNRYEHPHLNRIELKYPEADAAAVKVQLEKSKYQVTLVLGEEATQAKIREALQAIAAKGKDGGVLLLGFFGHGVQYGSDAFFCPYGTTVRPVRDDNDKIVYDRNQLPLLEPDPDSLVPMREMLDAMAISGASYKLLIADCCREDPSVARSVFGSELNFNNLPENTAALFACSRGERAFEHEEWGHGAFTRAFIDVCESHTDLTVNRLSDEVYKGVELLVREKNKRQTVNFIIHGASIPLGIGSAKPAADAMREQPLPGRPAPPSLLEPSSEINTLRNSIDMQLVPIPAGEFLMGSPSTEKGRFGDELPHRVTISRDLHFGITEVTQAQYQAVMQTNPSTFKQPQHPVETISWEQATEFCRRLSELPEEKAAGRVYRLPTEAEWEYACRAGNDASYSFGDASTELAEYAWFKASATGAQTFAVKQKSPNAWGLHDMHGNVNEWCSDWYGDYRSGAATDPQGPTDGTEKVIRGGSYLDSEKLLRSASRLSYPPSSPYSHTGFRVVMEQR